MTRVILDGEVLKRVAGSGSLGARGRRLVLAAASGGVVTAASNLGTLLTFPIVIRTLGETRFGVYALVTAVAAMLPFADFGVGLAVVTELAHTTGRDDVQAARRVVATAAAILVAAAVLVAILFGFVTAWVSWTRLLGTGTSVPAAEVRQAMALLVVCFAVGLPGSLGYKVLYALQETHVANWWQIVPVPLTVASVAAGSLLEADIAWFVVSAVGIPSVVALCATFWVLGRRHRELRPSIALVTWRHARSLLRLGSVIAFQSVTIAVGYQVDVLVVSHFLDVREVAVYSVSARVAAVATAFTSVVFFGLWPAFSEALARGDEGWARSSLRRAEIGAALISVVFVLGTLLLFRPVVAVLSGNSLVPSTLLLLAVSAWTAVRTMHYPMAVLLNAAGVGSFLVWCGSAMALVNLGLSVVLTRAIGVSGPMWGSALSVLACSVLPAVLYLRRRLSGSGRPLVAASLSERI
jgi:O-antigen/teichoic acid export membrane protein